MAATKIQLSDGRVCIPLTLGVDKLRRSMSGNRPSVSVWRDASEDPGLKVYVKKRYDEADRRLAQAIREGELQVYVLNPSAAGDTPILQPIDSSVVGSLHAVMGGVVDELVNLRAAAALKVEKAIGFPIRQGVLVLLNEDFELWRWKERRRRTWDSQYEQKKRGRPSKRATVQRIVKELVRTGQWTTICPFDQLVTLVNKRFPKPVSDATVRRSLTDLRQTTKNPGFDCRGGIRQRAKRMNQAVGMP